MRKTWFLIFACACIAVLGIGCGKSRWGGKSAKRVQPAASESSDVSSVESGPPAPAPAEPAPAVPAAVTPAAAEVPVSKPVVKTLIDGIADRGSAWRHFSEGDKYEPGFTIKDNILLKPRTQKNCRVDRSIAFTKGEIAFEFELDGNYWEIAFSAAGQSGNGIGLAFDRGALGRHTCRIAVTDGKAVISFDGAPVETRAKGIKVTRMLKAPINTGVNIRIFTPGSCALSFHAFTVSDTVTTSADTVAVPVPVVPVAASVSKGPALAETPGDIRVLSGCNNEAEKNLISWSSRVRVELTDKHATEGAGAARVTFLAGKKYAGFTLKGDLVAGWDKFKYVTFDVYNPYPKEMRIHIRIDDAQSTNSDYTTYYGRSFKLFPGGNQIKIKISRMPNQVQPWLQRNLDPKTLKQFIVWFYKTASEDTDLYFDNFALRNPPTLDLPAGMRAFAFGPADSDHWPGFETVSPQTLYAEAAGHGFKSIDGLHGLDDNFDREGVKHGETMCGTGIYRNGPMTFIVKLKPGRYKLWGAAGKTVYPKRAYSITLNGKTIFKSEAGDRFKGLDPVGMDYTRKQTIWEMLAAGQLYDEFAAETTVTDRPVEITIAGDYGSWQGGGLRTLIFYPVGNTEAEGILAEMLRQRKDKFLAKWRELKPAEQPALPPLTPEEKARGFMFAYRHYEEEISPYFVPAAKERLERIAIAATPGEKEPAVFIIYPTADADKATVTVSDLAGSPGTIPADAVKIEYVHYRYMKGQGGISVIPSHIVPRNNLPLEKGIPRQIWMTVTPPSNAAPGKYAGTVTVATAAGTGSFLLELEVYPFKLDSVADCGLIYAHIWGVPSDRSDMEAAVACLMEHNCNSATLSGAVKLDTGEYKRSGKVVIDFSKLDMAMEVMRAGGMSGPVPLFDMSIQGEGGGNSYSHIGLGKGQALDTDRYFKAIEDVTRQIKARAEAKNYLPVLMYPVTELSNDPNMGPPYLERLVKAFRRVDDIKLICSLNTPKDIVCAKYLDHMMVNWGLNLTEERLARIRNDGAKLWFQNIGKCRYNEGFLMMKTGAIGRRQFTVSLRVPGARGAGGDPFNNFVGGGNSSMFRTAEGAVPNVNLKWMSEGVDDYRYGRKLLSMIARARKQGSAKALAAADKAQQAYDGIMGQIYVGTAGGEIERDGRCDRMGNYHDKSTYDRFRKILADNIILVQKAME